MRVLRTQGIESEAPLAFAALQRLLRPLMPLAEVLPAQQGKALRVAFGMEAGEGAGDRFLVFLAALSLGSGVVRARRADTQRSGASRPCRPDGSATGADKSGLREECCSTGLGGSAD